MSWAGHWGSLAAASALLLPELGWARVPTRLVYARAQSAKDCPDEPALIAAVAARLTYDPFSPWGDQTILAAVSRSQSGVLGRVELIDHDGISQGSRQVKVTGDDCGELILALSLAISITLDPLHVGGPPVELEPPALPSTPPPHPAESSVPGASAEPTSGSALLRRDVTRAPASPTALASSWHVRGGALTTYALASRVSVGGRLGIDARRGRWSLGLEGWTSLPVAWDIEGGGRIKASLWASAVAPCVELVSGMRLCALGSIGSLRSESVAVTSPRSERVLHVAAGGRLSFSWPLGHTLELLASADLAATLNRPRFQLDGAEVWRPSPWFGLLGVGASTRFF